MCHEDVVPKAVGRVRYEGQRNIGQVYQSLELGPALENEDLALRVEGYGLARDEDRVV